MNGFMQLVADIGGTNIRFACVHPDDDNLHNISNLQCEDFPRLEDAIASYLDSIAASGFNKICLAVAAPVTQDKVALTNNPWTFSKSELQQKLGVEVLVINDFSAQAYCLDMLKPQELEWLGAPRPTGENLRVIIGPGPALAWLD